MLTASFRTYTGPGRISIARWTPRDYPPGYRVFSALAPGAWAKIPTGNGRTRWIDTEGFLAGYACQLAALDPRSTWDRLHQLAAPHEPVLLCWEAPPFTEQNWCHRRLVAAWFKQTLGYEVAEWRGCHRARLRGAISPLFSPAI
jgi:hypothetical protein